MLFDRFNQPAADSLTLKLRIDCDVHLTDMPVALHSARAAKAHVSAQLAILQGDKL
ncbi:hypothetical protein D3C86_1969180 [compost metagenome]